VSGGMAFRASSLPTIPARIIMLIPLSISLAVVSISLAVVSISVIVWTPVPFIVWPIPTGTAPIGIGIVITPSNSTQSAEAQQNQ
jgi:hypothetical protein